MEDENQLPMVSQANLFYWMYIYIYIVIYTNGYHFSMEIGEGKQRKELCEHIMMDISVLWDLKWYLKFLHDSIFQIFYDKNIKILFLF